MVKCIKKMMESSGKGGGGSFVWSVLFKSCTVR